MKTNSSEDIADFRLPIAVLLSSFTGVLTASPQIGDPDESGSAIDDDLIGNRKSEIGNK